MYLNNLVTVSNCAVMLGNHLRRVQLLIPLLIPPTPIPVP